jgi:hypothetical protein
MRPTYIAADVGGLLLTHAQPTIVDGGMQCGVWRATRIASKDGARRLGLQRVVEPSHAGDPGSATPGHDDLDALRALCAALWESDPLQPPERREGVVDPHEQAAILIAADGGDEESKESAAEVIDRLGLG